MHACMNAYARLFHVRLRTNLRYSSPMPPCSFYLGVPFVSRGNFSKKKIQRLTGRNRSANIGATYPSSDDPIVLHNVDFFFFFLFLTCLCNKSCRTVISRILGGNNVLLDTQLLLRQLNAVESSCFERKLLTVRRTTHG